METNISDAQNKILSFQSGLVKINYDVSIQTCEH